MDKWTPEELDIKAAFEAALKQAKEDYDAKVLEIWRDYNKAMQEFDTATDGDSAPASID